MELTEGLNILISLGIGLVIGLERESGGEKLVDKSKDSYAPLGVRTFSLVSILGCLGGIVSGSLLILSILISTVFGIILITYYVFHTWVTNNIGITTEISLLFTFILGFLVGAQALPTQLIIAVAVILLLMLTKKDLIKGIVSRVSENEINAFASFAIIALLILPFLPNFSIQFKDVPLVSQFLAGFGWNVNELADTELINPFKLWMVVALITGLDLLGHFLERTLGRARGRVLSSLAGGFISSTATTLSIAAQSKKLKAINTLVASAIFANMASFFQIALIIGAVNPQFLATGFPILAALVLSSFAAGLLFYLFREKNEPSDLGNTQVSLKDQQIINLVPALRFALIFLAIRLFSKISLELFGSSAFLVTTGLGALGGIDGVLINAAELAGRSIDYSLAERALILANAVNLASKAVYSFIQGSREFALKFGASMLITIIASVLFSLFF